MTYLSGADSAFGPSLATAQAARAAGWTFWFGYIGGPGAYHTWTAEEWAVLKETGFIPGVLWVPTMGMTEDPVAAAHEADAAATAAGLHGPIMLDTEHGMIADGARLQGYVDAFASTLLALGRLSPTYTGALYDAPNQARFDPLWGSATYPAPNQCIQYGPNTAPMFGGLLRPDGIDLNLCGLEFPLASWTPSAPTPPPKVDDDDMKVVEDDQKKGIWLAGLGGVMNLGNESNVAAALLMCGQPAVITGVSLALLTTMNEYASATAITAAVQTMLRAEFAPPNELWNRMVAAGTEALGDNAKGIEAEVSTAIGQSEGGLVAAVVTAMTPVITEAVKTIQVGSLKGTTATITFD